MLSSLLRNRSTPDEIGGAPGRTTVTTTAARLKREDFRWTKHDSAFSTWKVLIGSSDWEDYEAGKEGAERYRVANLPPVCGPGLYEIGVAVTVSRTDSSRDVSKLEPDRIVVVYLGQADNVRSRLQHYGRSGSHLGQQRRRWSAGFEPVGDVQGTGLFKEIFSRGYPIVYRWASMKSKSDAERMEAKLLEKFDYAWNKIGNGSRRSDDVLKKMEKISSKRDIPKILRILQGLGAHQMGIPIKPKKDDTDDGEFNIFGRVFKFGRSQPRLVSADRNIVTEEFNQSHICGVTLNDGSVCNEPPVEGRKRCVEHKGRRLTKNLIVAHVQAFPHKELVSTTGSVNILKEELSPICGVIQHDGSSCVQPPFPGRQRCEKHKGMRVNQTVSKSPDISCIVNVNVELSDLDLGDYCGVNFGDGNCCRRQPVKGRKRCKEHKGMRVDTYISKLSSRKEMPRQVYQENFI